MDRANIFEQINTIIDFYKKNIGVPAKPIKSIHKITLDCIGADDKTFNRRMVAIAAIAIMSIKEVEKNGEER